MKSPGLQSILIFVAAAFYPSLLGCGSGSSSVTAPNGDACTGISIAGVLQDSLTNQPVQQGWAFIETGTQIPATKLYNFALNQQATVDQSGKFSFCLTTISAPSALVLTALDSSGKAYPPFVTPITQAVNMGTIPMGGCRVDCDFEGQQQTSLPATVKGVITTSPISMRGTLLLQYAMNSPDQSSSIWNLEILAFYTEKSFTFSTDSSGCAQSIQFCAAYSFSLPSQNAVYPVKGGYSQQTGSPYYSALASIATPPICVPSSVLISVQQDGKSPLQGTPGADLTAAPINFSNCQ